MGIPALGLSLLGLLFILALILANAYFVATEFALVAVRRTQVKLWVQEGRIGSRSVEHALENLAREFPEQYKALRQELVQGTDAP